MRFKQPPIVGQEMTMVQHLGELRKRIFRSLLAVAIGAITLLLMYEPVLRLLTRPYRDVCAKRADFNCDGSLFTLGPLDGLTARMKIATYGGLILALPVILWQIWKFIVPALERREKQYAIPFIASSLVLFATGGYMAYWTLDKALEFLISWSGPDVTQAYQITKYISLVSLMALAYGIGFLSPVLIVFLQLVGIVTPRRLVKNWRNAIMFIFLTAAVITPSGDPISMLALAIPMTLLFAIAVFIGWLLVRRRQSASA